MNCNEIQRLLTNDFETAHDERVAAHLRECAECRDLKRDLASLRELSRGLEGVSASHVDLTQKILSEASSFSLWKRTITAPIVVVFLLFSLSAGVVWYSAIDSRAGRSAGHDLRLGSFSFPSEERQGPSYLDITVEEPNEGNYILRMPAVIEVQQTELHEDSYFLNISH